jgi:uncharacterized protein with von Willebrand factor type A (vWA) domain
VSVAADRSGSAGDRLLRKLATFGRILREAGIEVAPHRLQDALAALAAVDVTSREQCYWALRCTLTSREEDGEVFDAAFAAFWERRPTDATAPEQPPAPEPGADPAGAEEGGEALAESALDADLPDEGDDAEEGAAWSAVERLRRLDFADYTEEELRRSRVLVERVARAMPLRRSRRLRSAHDGSAIDKRRMLRSAMRTEGYPLVRLRRHRRLVPRKVVFLIDISGSMEPYARAMMMFLHAALRPGAKVEAFLFGTRLTRVTRQLARHDPDEALRAATAAVPDWGGGTRIGETLKTLNDDWGARGVTRGAVAVIVSDGWERGDVDLLSREMARLRRAAHTVVWVNPLAGEPGYEPLAQGMAAALPHVDRFLPGHNLRSLEVLAAVLESLSGERRASSAGVRAAA